MEVTSGAAVDVSSCSDEDGGSSSPPRPAAPTSDSRPGTLEDSWSSRRGAPEQHDEGSVESMSAEYSSTSDPPAKPNTAGGGSQEVPFTEDASSPSTAGPPRKDSNSGQSFLRRLGQRLSATSSVSTSTENSAPGRRTIRDTSHQASRRDEARKMLGKAHSADPSTLSSPSTPGSAFPAIASHMRQIPKSSPSRTAPPSLSRSLPSGVQLISTPAKHGSSRNPSSVETTASGRSPRRRQSLPGRDLAEAFTFSINMNTLPASGIPGVDEVHASFTSLKSLPPSMDVFPGAASSPPPTSMASPALPFNSLDSDLEASGINGEADIYRRSQERDARTEDDGHVPKNPKMRLLDLYYLLEDPSSSGAAFVVNMFITTMILLGTAVAVAGTTVSILFSPANQILKSFVEPVIMAIYALEWSLRLVAHCPTRGLLRQFWTNFLTYSDFFVFSVYFIEIPLNPNKISLIFRFSVLRLLRLTRLFRTYRYRSAYQMSIDAGLLAMVKSKGILWAMAHLAATAVFVLAAAIYFAERGTLDEDRGIWVAADGNASLFEDMPKACWFTFVTMTTTGYGDLVPKTWIGRILALPIMWMGVVLLALPSIVVGRHFIQIVDYWKAQHSHRTLPSDGPGRRERLKRTFTFTLGSGTGDEEQAVGVRKRLTRLSELNTIEEDRKAEGHEHQGEHGEVLEPNRTAAARPRKPLPGTAERLLVQSPEPVTRHQEVPSSSTPLHDIRPSIPSENDRDEASSAQSNGDPLKYDHARICQVTAEIIATRSTRELVEHIRLLRRSLEMHQRALSFAYHALEDLVEGLCDEYGSDEEYRL